MIRKTIIILLILLYATLETIVLSLIYNRYMYVSKYIRMWILNIHIHVQIEKKQLTHKGTHHIEHLTPTCCVFVTCVLEVWIDQWLTYCDRAREEKEFLWWWWWWVVNVDSNSLTSLFSFSLALFLFVEEFYSSRKDQTFFIYWFVLKSSSRLKFTLLSREFDCVSISN